jgi:hypothetical protein
MPTPYPPEGGRVTPCAAISSRKKASGLDQDAGAIAEQGIVAGGTAVLEVLQNLQTLLDDGVAFAVLDVDDKADAAGVMFVGGVVEPLLPGEDHLSFLNTEIFPGRSAGAPGPGRIGRGHGREKSRRMMGRTGFS